MPNLGERPDRKEEMVQERHGHDRARGALVGAVYAAIEIFESSLFETEKVRKNIVVVFDRSTAMSEKLGSAAKWDAAVRGVQLSLADSVAASDNLALRDFGRSLPR